MKMETFHLPYGNGQISFRLERRNRKTLAISVNPDAGVEVIAPRGASLEKIFEKVRKRAPWIRRQKPG
jgi:predicted metal-dependent hydrolase